MYPYKCVLKSNTEINVILSYEVGLLFSDFIAFSVSLLLFNTYITMIVGTIRVDMSL